jgi:toxin ParE1/3/4
MLETIDAKCTLLAKNPCLGSARPDLAPDLRYFPVGSYLILYRETSDGVEIVSILQGARRLENLV